MASLTRGKHPVYLLVQHPAAGIALPSSRELCLPFPGQMLGVRDCHGDGGQCDRRQANNTRQTVSCGTWDKLGKACPLKGIPGTEFPLTPSDGAAVWCFEN